MTQLQINGQTQDVNVPDEMPILWVLRDELGMTGTKFGCGMALCGACTVHIDGTPVRACLTPVSVASGRQLSPIEGMDADPVGRAVQTAWVDNNVAQCGYCQAGQIMSAAALLAKKPKPTDAEIDQSLASNLCRCGTYLRIRAAVKKAAGEP